jgi:CRISPR/Cas system-associated exonuclease Cas4 (RecB family)
LDPASTPDPVVLPEGWQLRGSIDLVEIATTGQQVRIRDYKTGKNKTKANLVIGSGEVLQPLLYALAAEQLLGQPASEGQLWFATAKSSFTHRSVLLNTDTRRDIADVLSIIDVAVREGTLGAAPCKDACTYCDYRSVCGPYEETRLKKKHSNDIAQLRALREKP